MVMSLRLSVGVTGITPSEWIRCDQDITPTIKEPPLSASGYCREQNNHSNDGEQVFRKTQKYGTVPRLQSFE